MSVASLDLCQELYELSGWGDDKLAEPDYHWVQLEENGDWKCSAESTLKWGNVWSSRPAYDFGYLLRKLPDHMHSLAYEVTYRLRMKKIDDGYFFEYSNHSWFRDHKSVFTRKGYDTTDESLAYGIKPVYSDTPEDAAAKLAIELFKQGILTQGDDGGER